MKLYNIIIVLLSPFFSAALVGQTPDEFAVAAVPVVVPTGTDALAPRLVQSGSTVILTWIESASQAEPEVKWAVFAASSWSPARTLVKSSAVMVNSADFPSMISVNERDLYAHWLQSAPGAGKYDYDVIIAHSPDRGDSWKILKPIRKQRRQGGNGSSYDGFVSLIPENGAARAVWVDGRLDSGDHRMTLRTALIADGEWKAEALLDDNICSCCDTSAVALPSGPAIVYRGRTQGEIRDITFVTKTAGGWTNPKTIHSDGWQMPGCPVNGPKLAHFSESYAVAWYTAPKGRGIVRVAFVDADNKGFAPPIDLDGVSQNGAIGRVNLVMTDENEAIVAWIGRTTDSNVGRLLLRRVNKSGKLSPTVTVANVASGSVSGFPQIALVEDQILISWTDAKRDISSEKETTEIKMVKVGIAQIPRADRDYTPAQQVQRKRIVLSEIQLPDLQGNVVDLEKMRGKVLLISLWATWCEPCHREQEELVKLYEKYKNRGLKIVAINLDLSRAAKNVPEFVEKHGIKYPVLLDPRGISREHLSVQGVPATFLVLPSGEIVKKKIGYHKMLGGEVESLISELLDAPPL